MVIIFPTDTVYGIGASVYDSNGIEQIYEIKNRSISKKMAVLCANIGQVKEIAYLDDISLKLANKFWPGALTLILKSKLDNETIAVRIPNHKLAIKLLNAYGPMATTSVNTSGCVPINDYDEIVNIYSNRVDKIYPNEESIIGVSSTIINVVDGLKIIREGSITEEEIQKVVKSE